MSLVDLFLLKARFDQIPLAISYSVPNIRGLCDRRGVRSCVLWMFRTNSQSASKFNLGKIQNVFGIKSSVYLAADSRRVCCMGRWGS